MTFSKLLNLITESNAARDEHFRKQFIGAFSIVFDIDTDEIIDSDKIHQSYGNSIGLNNLGIGEYWFPPNHSNCCVTAKFFILYKTKRYEVSLEVINWLDVPTTEDFINNNQGKNKGSIKRNPVNFSLPMTATGGVTLEHTYYDVELGREVEDYDVLSPSVHAYPEHFVFEDLSQLAKKVKSIIDGRDKKRTNRLPEKPTPINKMPKKPELVPA